MGDGQSVGYFLRSSFVRSLVDPTATTQYDRLLASSCRSSLSVTLCIMALRVGVQGKKLHQNVYSRHMFLVRLGNFSVRSSDVFSHKIHRKKRVEQNANVSFFEKQKQESLAIAKTTARCAQYMGALQSFESPRKRPRLLFPKFVKGFCSDRY